MANSTTDSLLNRLDSSSSLDGLGREHHILGLLFWGFKQFKDNTLCKSIWIKNWHRNELAQKEFRSLISSLKLSQPVIALKGYSLQAHIYQDLGARYMSDIDLLIEEDDFELVEAELADRGYQKLASTKWRANNFKSEWSKFVDGTEICFELHSKLYYHIDNSYSSFETSSLEDGVLRLSTQEEFIHLCTHYVFQHTFQKMYWAFDLYFYWINNFTQEDITSLSNLSKKYKVYNSFCFCLGVLRDHFGVELVFDDAKSVSVDTLWESSRNSFQYFVLKHRTRDSFLEAVKYDLGLFLSKF